MPFYAMLKYYENLNLHADAILSQFPSFFLCTVTSVCFLNVRCMQINNYGSLNLKKSVLIVLNFHFECSLDVCVFCVKYGRGWKGTFLCFVCVLLYDVKKRRQCLGFDIERLMKLNEWGGYVSLDEFALWSLI